MRWLAVLALGGIGLATACGPATPGPCSPGVNECLARCPGGGRSDPHEHPPPTTRNTQSPCEQACQSRYCH